MTFNVHLVPTIITLIISFVILAKTLPSAAQRLSPPSLRQHLLRNASSLVGVTASYDGGTLFVFLATTTFTLDLGGGRGSSYSSGEGTPLNVSQAAEMAAWDFLPMFSAIVGELAKGGGKQQQSNFSSLPVTIHFLSSVYTFLTFLSVEREGGKEGHSRRLLLLYVQKTYGTGAASRTLTTLLLDRPFAVISRLRGWPPSSSSNDLPPEHSCYVFSMDDQGRTRIRRGIVEGE